MEQKKPSRHQLSKTRWGFVALGLLLVVLAKWAIEWHAQPFRERLNRESNLRMCMMNLKFIANSPKSAYVDSNGGCLYSWRCRAFLVLEKRAPSKVLEMPWKKVAKTHGDATATGPEEYCYDGENRPCVYAVTGPGTAFDPELSLKWSEVGGDTIILAEVANSPLHWMECGDLDIRLMPHRINPTSGIGISSRHKGGAHVVFADLSCWFISEDVPWSILEQFLTVESARHAGRSSLLPYRIE